MTEWSQDEANQRAWDNLKERFYKNCNDQAGWIVDEATHTIYNTDTGTGVTSCVYPFWRNIQEVTWSQR